MNEKTSTLIQEGIRKALKRSLRAELHHAHFNLDSAFTDLGLDSLDKLELLFEIENHFDLEIPDDKAVKMNSVRDLITYIANKKFQEI